MKIEITRDHRNPNDLSLEVVERKGIGHPDTLADLIADEFSARYSRFCLKRFGHIANHAVDKIVLLGGTAQVDFGSHRACSPITACLFGKASLAVGTERIPIEDLFKEAVDHILTGVFGSNILDNVEFSFSVHDGIGKDHLPGFYRPRSVSDIIKSNATINANDTAYCCGYAPLSNVERLVILIENHVCSATFKERFPNTGWDVKVMAVRYRRELRITCCIPFIASLTPSKQDYQRSLNAIHKDLLELISIESVTSNLEVNLSLNTRDGAGQFAYLTVFGTALDKGDQGVVGRGNRFAGIISSARPSSIEAPSGKNPVRHAGKLYSLVAEEISWSLAETAGGSNTETIIVSRNGDPITAPDFLNISLDPSSELEDDEIRRVVVASLNNIHRWTERYIKIDPIKRHVGQGEIPSYLARIQ